LIHTNTVEGYYSIFKRGMRGVYQHCKEKHFHRHLSEFDFRFALGVDDVSRADRALKGIVGKRLIYRGYSSVRGPMGKVGEKQKRTPKIKDKKQSERFKETARELGADESGDAFERVFDELAKVKPKTEK
jgi:hypothetical protein